MVFATWINPVCLCSRILQGCRSHGQTTLGQEELHVRARKDEHLGVSWMELYSHSLALSSELFDALSDPNITRVSDFAYKVDDAVGHQRGAS